MSSVHNPDEHNLGKHQTANKCWQCDVFLTSDGTLTWCDECGKIV